MVRNIVEAAKTFFCATAALAMIGGFVYGVASNVWDGWTHRHEATYLVPRAYDPLWKKAGFVPKDLICYSPARCEPNGKPQMQYFVLLKEYQARRWGLDPTNETPVKGDPFI